MYYLPDKKYKTTYLLVQGNIYKCIIRYSEQYHLIVLMSKLFFIL